MVFIMKTGRWKKVHPKAHKGEKAMQQIADLFGLEGKRAVVTGASGGIGAVIAKRLASAGAHVVVHFRSKPDEAQTVVADIKATGGSAEALRADLTDKLSVTALMEKAGPVDILINNAGAYPNAGCLEMSEDDWRHMYAANVDTVMLCSQAAARQMVENGGGVILNIGSIAGFAPGPDHSHYNSAKAAVAMYGRSIAQELGPDSIRVNTISPGLIYREGLEEAWPDGLERWLQQAPLGEVGQAEDVANACLFLASDAARHITGIDMLVDCGMSATALY